MSEYGLPSRRGEDGQLLPADHEYQFEEETVQIKLLPPTIGQLEEYEELGEELGGDGDTADDVDPDDVDEGSGDLEDIELVVDRHLIKPDHPAEDLTIEEVMAYFVGIVDYSVPGGAGDDLQEEVREEIDRREESAGN